MNKLHKVGLTALATSLVASSAYAGDLSVSGGASISYTGLSNAAAFLKLKATSENLTKVLEVIRNANV